MPFTGTGLHLVFQLTGTNAYNLLIIDNATGATTFTSGTVTGALNSVALFNNNAGDGESAANLPNYYSYFNTIRISGQ